MHVPPLKLSPQLIPLRAQQARPSDEPTNLEEQLFVPHMRLPASSSGGGGTAPSDSGVEASGMGGTGGGFEVVASLELQPTASHANARTQGARVVVLRRKGDENFIGASSVALKRECREPEF
jgi:hypothetical protein